MNFQPPNVIRSWTAMTPKDWRGSYRMCKRRTLDREIRNLMVLILNVS